MTTTNHLGKATYQGMFTVAHGSNGCPAPGECVCKTYCYQLADIALTSSSGPTAEAPPAVADPG